MSVRPPKPIKLLSFLKENLMQKRHIKYVFHLNDVWTIWCWCDRARYYLDINSKRVCSCMYILANSQFSKCYTLRPAIQTVFYFTKNFLLKKIFSLEFNLCFFFSLFAGRIPSFYRSFIATCQVVCLCLVQSPSGQAEIL